MPTVTTDDGVAISYATAGDGPPDLLFMHGWAGSGRYFDATIEHLDLTRLRAVTYDLRGHRATVDRFLAGGARVVALADFDAQVHPSRHLPAEAPVELVVAQAQRRSNKAR